MQLGLSQITDLFYEGQSINAGRGVWPHPVITQAALGYPNQDLLASLDHSAFASGWKTIFREDSFDPVTRIRRGRLYRFDSTTRWRVLGHPAGEMPTGEYGPIWVRDLLTWKSIRVSDDFPERTTRGLTLALGARAWPTFWRVVSLEGISSGEELLTLKSRQMMGVLPDLHRDRVPLEHLSSVEKFVGKLADDAHRADPASVIDHCREAANAILLAFLRSKDPGAKPQDLGATVAEVESLGEFPIAATSAAKMIARLHPRRKVVEQEKRGLREVTEPDAELAVLSIGLMLCDLGWASWS
jgi:hypothetical protein